MDKAFEISKNSILTMDEALDIFAVTGSWDMVRRWGSIANKGFSCESILLFIAMGVTPDGLEDLIDVLSKPPVHIQKKDIPRIGKQIETFLLQHASE